MNKGESPRAAVSAVQGLSSFWNCVTKCVTKQKNRPGNRVPERFFTGGGDGSRIIFRKERDKKLICYRKI